jgi:hypothetical protein
LNERFGAGEGPLRVARGLSPQLDARQLCSAHESASGQFETFAFIAPRRSGVTSVPDNGRSVEIQLMSCLPRAHRQYESGEDEQRAAYE